jgi:hypothetical protein
METDARDLYNRREAQATRNASNPSDDAIRAAITGIWPPLLMPCPNTADKAAAQEGAPIADPAAPADLLPDIAPQMSAAFVRRSALSRLSMASFPSGFYTSAYCGARKL